MSARIEQVSKAILRVDCRWILESSQVLCVQALVSSGAIARSVANCARISMMPADKTQLEALLKACYADSAESSKNISHVAYEVSQAMQGAPHETQVQFS